MVSRHAFVGLALFATYSMIAKPELERVFRRHKWRSSYPQLQERMNTQS